MLYIYMLHGFGALLTSQKSAWMPSTPNHTIDLNPQLLS